MNSNDISPWSFSNSDENMVSPNGICKIEYSELYEIAMGAPVGGTCFCIYLDKTRIKIHDFCGGPPVWNTTGVKVALPIWTKDRNQRIAILDTELKTLTIFSLQFRVLHLLSFIESIVHGKDSPIHMTQAVHFDTVKERIDKIIHLI